MTSSSSIEEKSKRKLGVSILADERDEIEEEL